tara:strand:+ start:298 stop:405 length:108 start_codon:yes stop_codon:yes gene_type:complete
MEVQVEEEEEIILLVLEQEIHLQLVRLKEIMVELV